MEIILTKEAFIEYALNQQRAMASSLGLTLEEYQQAILNGTVVQQQSPPTGSL